MCEWLQNSRHAHKEDDDDDDDEEEDGGGKDTK